MPYCAKCKKKRDDEQVRKCCDGTYYCNRKCERANYTNHKEFCTKPVVVKEPAPPLPEPALIKDIYDPFTRLKRGDYLQGRPDIDVYKILIDTYRLRLSDDNFFAGVRHGDSIYDRSKDEVADFHRFLDRAKAIPRMMPSWWDAKKEAECVELGRQTGWSSLTAMTNESDVRKHYNLVKNFTARKNHTKLARKYYNDVAREFYYDIYIDVQLRRLAEEIYGTGISDTEARFLREAMMDLSDEELAEITETGNFLRKALFCGMRKYPINWFA
ncbi:hypothetical protein F4859DRAFT_509866 [Xylaria cf. heliscus]|nr:hypothetical protein F4859DRAFT_509866 [Xylaria cf. heliscus]